MRWVMVLVVTACGAKESETCPEGETLTDGQCVSRCGAGKELRKGECVDTPASLLRRLEAAKTTLCGCRDDDCRMRSKRDMDALGDVLISARVNATDADKERAKEIRARAATCLPKPATIDAGAEPDAVAELTAISERMCACENKRCANAANQAYGQWTRSPEGAAATKREKKQVMKIVAAYTKCLNGLMGD